MATPAELRMTEKIQTLERVGRAILHSQTAPGSGISPRRVSATAFVILILSGFSALAKVYDSDGSVANVQALHAAAHDGDTITLPSGTFRWTAPLKITKGITLQGNTTITGAGTANAAATDATIIKDDTPRNGVMLDVELNPNQSFRLTGVTFAPGASTVFNNKVAFHLHSNGSSPNNSVRIDHCHFSQLYQGKIIHPTGWIFGVADHNLIEVRRKSFPFYVVHGSYGGTRQKLGNGAWADYPWFWNQQVLVHRDQHDHQVQRSCELFGGLRSWRAMGGAPQLST